MVGFRGWSFLWFSLRLVPKGLENGAGSPSCASAHSSNLPREVPFIALPTLFTFNTSSPMATNKQTHAAESATGKAN